MDFETIYFIFAGLLLTKAAKINRQQTQPPAS